ncbi:hypothetical protein P4H70_23055 [Paenibacillus ehimensis]|uniref:hypothetical protein n=1 Tax=Paenibacillus ehimensis TaxID=79264 RepID=UPI002DB94020|nr:hypothetical protein [Paenibacillus ehimensis]MEC0211824.1 hypothetical protein [Paenibacillus ehimensis]
MRKNNVVILELDRPRQVKFTYTALQTLSAMTGKTMHELDDAFDTADFKSIEVIAYCGLLYDAAKNKETLTPESIVALLDEAPSFRLVIEKLIEAWMIAFGAPDTVAATPEGNQPKKAAEK